MIAAPVHTDSIDMVCPSCGEPLSMVATDLLLCEGERLSYRKKDGIWDMVAPVQSERFRRFETEYNEIRHREGRGSADSAYFRRLPYEDTTGRHRRDWRIRAVSHDCFVECVLAPLERVSASGTLRILDLGAGNAWLSNRLALRGHEVCAVDLRTDRLDGLGARVHYRTTFTCIRAAFDRLPFGDGCFDVIVFNASLHYSENYERTLGEALRVLRRSGRVVVIDSPMYRRASSGERMVRERQRRFRRDYGFASDVLASEDYLTERRLTQLSARLGVTWSIHKPRFGPRWRVRRTLARLRNRREPARFVVLSGRKALQADDAIAHMQPRRLWRSIARAGLRLRFLARQRHRLRRSAVEEFHGLRLQIPPDVFHPIIFRSGAFLAELILEDVLPPGRKVLDLGCGSGICGIAAATRGAAVTAVDVNPDAVRTSRENAELNSVRVRVVESDLFEEAGTFDVVLFNPPYFGGAPGSAFDLAWRSNDVVERFSASLGRHLSPNGFALVVLSSDGRCGEYLRQFEADGHRISRVAERRHLNESLTVFRLE